MKAITTRFLPATGLKPSRVKATEPDGQSLVLSTRCLPDRPPGYHSASFRGGPWNHYTVAKKLYESLGWPGEIYGGWTGKNYAWVLVQ